MAATWKSIYHTTFGHSIFSTTQAGLVTITIQELTEEQRTNKEIRLPFEQPCVIEYGKTEKEGVIQGATCTLKVITETDREFLPLYSIDPGKVRISISESGSSGVWVGTLDMESYEEPFSTECGYESILVFTDFGYLKSVDFNMHGICTLYDILSSAMQVAGLDTYSVTDCLSTQLDQNGIHVLNSISINCSNFYDETNYPMTYYDVIESILQPLAAKIIQKDKIIYVYDYHYLYNAQEKTIKWASDNQRVYLDKFVNKINIILSNYSSEQLIAAEQTTPFDFNTYKYNVNTSVPYPVIGTLIPCLYFSWFNSFSSGDTENISFTLFFMNDLTNDEKQMINVDYWYHVFPFHINPIGGSEECDGFVARFFPNGGNSAYGDTTPWAIDYDDIIMKVYVNNISTLGHPEQFRLNLSMEMILDYRYNPFNMTDENNSYGESKNNFLFYSHTFKPLKVELLDDNGNVKKIYSNSPFLDRLCNRQMEAWIWGGSDWSRWDDESWRNLYTWDDVAETNGLATNYMQIDNISIGAWYDPDDEWFDKVPAVCWLDYYDLKNLGATKTIKTGCGTIGGWQKNKHTVGSMFKSNSHFEKLCDGLTIPYPPEGGTIRISVLRGYRQHNNCCPFDVRSNYEYITKKGFSRDERWVMYKRPQLKIVKNTILQDDAKYDDVEMSCYVNDYAADSIDINLTSGTGEIEMPGSLARFLRTSNLQQITNLVRGSYEGTAEKLLAGTLFSQYYGRKLILSGTSKWEKGLNKFKDSSMNNGEVYAICGETIDLKTGTTDATYVQFSDDVYEKE